MIASTQFTYNYYYTLKLQCTCIGKESEDGKKFYSIQANSSRRLAKHNYHYVTIIVQ